MRVAVASNAGRLKMNFPLLPVTLFLQGILQCPIVNDVPIHWHTRLRNRAVTGLEQNSLTENKEFISNLMSFGAFGNYTSVAQHLLRLQSLTFHIANDCPSIPECPWDPRTNAIDSQ